MTIRATLSQLDTRIAALRRQADTLQGTRDLLAAEFLDAEPVTTSIPAAPEPVSNRTLAMKKRWAAAKKKGVRLGGNRSAEPTKKSAPKKTANFSQEGLKKLSEAAKARWAKQKAAGTKGQRLTGVKP